MHAMKKMAKYISFFCLLLLVPLLFLLVLTLVIGIVPSWFQPADTIFRVSNGIKFCLFLLETISVLVWFVFLSRRYQFGYVTEERYGSLVASVKKYKVVLALALIMVLYAMLMETSYITPNTVTVRHMFQPRGKTYSYSDIIGVDTGIYGSKQSLLGDKTGSFYYRITLKDGTQVDVSNISGSTAGKDLDVYALLEAFDKNVMRQPIAKISSLESLGYGQFDANDKACIERIIKNQ